MSAIRSRQGSLPPKEGSQAHDAARPHLRLSDKGTGRKQEEEEGCGKEGTMPTPTSPIIYRRGNQASQAKSIKMPGLQIGDQITVESCLISPHPHPIQEGSLGCHKGHTR